MSNLILYLFVQVKAASIPFNIKGVSGGCDSLWLFQYPKKIVSPKKGTEGVFLFSLLYGFIYSATFQTRLAASAVLDSAH
jgi:hypothetical protein